MATRKPSTRRPEIVTKPRALSRAEIGSSDLHEGKPIDACMEAEQGINLQAKRAAGAVTQVYLAYETLANPQARRKYDLGRVKRPKAKVQKKPGPLLGKSLGGLGEGIEE